MGHQDGCRVGNNGKWNTKFRLERSSRENGPTFSDIPSCPGIFQGDKATKRFPFTAEPKFPKILTKWKAPAVTLTSSLEFLVCVEKLLRKQ